MCVGVFVDVCVCVCLYSLCCILDEGMMVGGGIGIHGSVLGSGSGG